MKNILYIFILFIFISSCSNRTLLNDYRKEVSELKTEAEINMYWDKLLKLDQDALEIGKYTTEEHDSISITHMMRTALMLEIHGVKSYKSNNIVPEMHLTHNNYGPSTLAFWPIIKKCVTVRGDAKLIQYPVYQLEAVANNFYGYSVYGENNRHANLLKKLNLIESNSVSKDLYEVLNYQKKIKALDQVKVLGIWQKQSFKNIKELGFFEFIELSDSNLYHKQNERLQKLELLEIKSNSKIYRIEKEPFGWSFKLDSNGDLSLIDDENEVLIFYTKYTSN